MMNIREIVKNNIYVRILEDEFHLGLIPYIIGYEKCRRNKSVITFNKDEYVMHFVLRGKGVAIIDGKRYHLEKNMCFLYYPGQVISYTPDRSDPWEYVWLEFSGISTELLLKTASISRSNPVISYSESLLTEELINLLLLCSDINKGTSITITSHILQVFNLLISYVKKATEKKYTKKEKEVNKIIHFIEANYSSPLLNIKLLSDEFYINPSYLSRIFKQVTGLSPIQYIINLKMNKAKEMLSLDIYTIKEISDTIGYNNQFYFSRTFKEHFGLSPAKYKKTNHGIIN